MDPLPPCPPNSFRFNSTLCACNPGYFIERSAKNCTLFRVSPNEWAVNSDFNVTPKFFESIFSFNSIKRFTQSQAVFLEATLVAVLSWLFFCLVVRFGKIDGGRSIWFRIRWWISRLDFCFATRHWLDDQKVVRKRKTELGGTFSVASWIFFVGLFAALLYQIITKRTIEVHSVRPANAPDFLSFINDMEFNITTISSMSCSHLRGLGTLVTGTPGFIDYRVYPLSVFGNYYCRNTSRGPTITLKCNSCQIRRDNYYISWQFVDLPNNPATAVGFQFNLTSRNHGDMKHMSYVSGTLKSDNNIDERPRTIRGTDVNVLKFHLFPRMYHNLHDLRLFQPLFHEFLPGSSFFETRPLRASLQNSTDGLINTTLSINFLSDYIVEIRKESILGPVSFLANVGGLLAISIAIFLYLLMQCEFRIKKLRNEDTVLRNIRSRRRAQLHWDKLRKFVMYTWGCSELDKNKTTTKQGLPGSMIIESFPRIGSLHKRKPQTRRDSIYLDRSLNSTVETNFILEITQAARIESSLTEGASNVEGRSRSLEGEHVLGHKVLGIKKGRENEHSSGSCGRVTSHSQILLPNDKCHSPSANLEFNNDGGTDISDIRKNLQNLYDYNVWLREQFAASQSLLEDLIRKVPPSSET